MTARKEYILVGLPETGKTTFLAALWHAVCSRETGEELRFKRLPHEHRYLNLIREKWAKAEVQDRTIPSAEELVSLILDGDMVEGEVELCIPDLSGESYESIWTERRIDEERAEAIKQAEGSLHF